MPRCVRWQRERQTPPQRVAVLGRNRSPTSVGTDGPDCHELVAGDAAMRAVGIFSSPHVPRIWSDCLFFASSTLSSNGLSGIGRNYE